MTPQEEHERLAKELNREVAHLERDNERLEDKIEQARSQWRAKRQDPNVPGAVPDENADPEPTGEDPSA